jgi:hypothetical protein
MAILMVYLLVIPANRPASEGSLVNILCAHKLGSLPTGRQAAGVYPRENGGGNDVNI